MTTGTGRKIRGDSKLDQLSAEQQASVRHWLGEKNYTYAHVAELIQTQFGVSVGRSALGVYYQRHVLPERHDDDIESATALAALPVADFDAATVNHAKALAFNAIARPDPQIDTAAKLLGIVHRVEKQEMARERLALEKRRIALREALAARPPRVSQRRSVPARHASTLVHLPDTPDLIHQLSPAARSSLPVAAESSIPASVTSAPPPRSSCPNSDAAASLPLPSSPTPDSSFPSFSSAQPLLQKIPQNSPLFPTYSDITSPSSPHASSSTFDLPSCSAPTPDRPHPLDPIPFRVPHHRADDLADFSSNLKAA